jgi:hypothetical protein
VIQLFLSSRRRFFKPSHSPSFLEKSVIFCEDFGHTREEPPRSLHSTMAHVVGHCSLPGVAKTICNVGGALTLRLHMASIVETQFNASSLYLSTALDTYPVRRLS